MKTLTISKDKEKILEDIHTLLDSGINEFQFDWKGIGADSKECLNMKSINEELMDIGIYFNPSMNFATNLENWKLQ